MVHVAPLRCKFISASISCKLWIKHLAPPRFSTLNRVKIQREKLNMRIWRNWQTRMVQVHVKAISCRFKSCYPHQESAKNFLRRFSVLNAVLTQLDRVPFPKRGCRGFESRIRIFSSFRCSDKSPIKSGFFIYSFFKNMFLLIVK